MPALSDQVAIVTGASAGIGEATARNLAARGATVVLVARRAERIESLAKRVAGEGGRAIAVVCDVADRTAVKNVVDTALRDFGRVDILINNAGIMPLAPMVKCRMDDWDAEIDVNIKGLLYCIGHVLPIMLEQKTGHIVNVSSVAGRIVFPNAAVYCATKFAVNALSDGLRNELAEMGHSDGNSIRVSVISPGVVATELRHSIRDAESKEAASAYYDSFSAPLTSDDIADTILFTLEAPAHVSIGDILVRPTAQLR